MNNYQLYRTNLKLGGQMKWDLLINSINNTLYINDFHLTPISDRTPYTYKIDEYIIKNKHQDNVKKYYNETKSFFYSECIDTEFSSCWPIICNKENEKPVIYSNTYDMGCRRSKRFNAYDKQYEFLCPVWIEHLDKDKELVFTIEIKDTESNFVLGRNALIFKPINKVNTKFHDDFLKYFKKYLRDSGLETGSDDLLNINFTNNTAFVTGLNASTGLFETRGIDTFTTNLKLVERPLMETDNLLLQLYENNNLICKQLFNFNLCFNIEDICSKNIVKMLLGKAINISVTVGYINEDSKDSKITNFELKDFYTEYDYIDKHVTSKFFTTYKKNVFTYLKDNEYIEFIDKNKFCQSICHWSLYDNNDYIFNIYDGFSGIYVDTVNEKDEIYENTHQYKDAPNTLLTAYSDIQNSGGWLTVYNADIFNDISIFLNNPYEYRSKGIYINGNNSSGFIKNIKYSNIPPVTDSNNSLDGIYIIGINATTSLYLSLFDSPNNTIFDIYNLTMPPKNIFGEGVQLLMLRMNDLVMFITNNIDNLSFAKFTKYLDSITKTEEDLQKLKNLGMSDLDIYILKNIRTWLFSKIDPKLIVFNSSIEYTYVNSPTIHTTEIEYYKKTNNDIKNYVVRYDGKIKPTFVDKPNTLYYKDYVSDKNIISSIYLKHNLANYEPKYPSIGLCGIKKCNTWSYNKYPKVKVTGYDPGNDVDVDITENNIEYTWFNSSKHLVLSPKLSFSVIKQKNDIRTVTDFILEYLAEYYNIDANTNAELLKYIQNLYDYNNTWDYVEYDKESNILYEEYINKFPEYIFNINLKLKIYK